MDKKSKKKWFGPTKIKRLFDICASFLALVVLSPLFLVICIVNLFTPECSVFFSHERRGRRGKPFTIYKFQTMKNNTPNCATGELENPEQYITKFGKFLRKTSLDELPQLFNVLRGYMSFVGPRPEVQEYTDLYTEEQRQVFLVRPGITGVASIRYRNENDLLAASDDPNRTYIQEILPEKLRLDLSYIPRAGVVQDIALIFETLAVVIRG